MSERDCPGCYPLHVRPGDPAGFIFGILCRRHCLGVFGLEQETEADMEHAAAKVPRDRVW